MKYCFHFFLCLSLLLTACQPPNSDLMRLSTWVSSPSETALFEETIDDFRQTHPSVDFKFEPIPGNYGEKLQLMLGTHTAPDVFFLKGYLAKSYMSFNVLEPMDDYMANTPNFDKEDFLPFSLEAFQWEGKQYGLPKDFNPYVLFYNKKLFKEAGLDTVPSNWEELEAFSRKLTKDTDGDGEIDQHGIIIEPVMEMVMPFVFQNGGAFQDEDGKLAIAEPEFIEALEYYHGLYKKGIATIPTDVGVGWNGDAFGREKVAMAISGGWLMPFMKDNYPDVDYGIAYLPKGKERATVAFTTSYSIAKDSKYKEDSWELVNYMVGQEGMGKWTSKGLAMPTRRSVAEKNGFYDHPIYSVYMKSAEFAKPFQVEYSERGFEEVVVALQAIFYKNESPEEAMKKISKRIEKYRLVSR